MNQNQMDTIPSNKLYEVACTSQCMWDLVKNMKPRYELDYMVLRYLMDRNETNAIAIMQFPDSCENVTVSLHNQLAAFKPSVAWCRNPDASKFAGNLERSKIAVAQCGLALRDASDELKGNAEVVKLAVAQCGWALMHASEEMKGNEEVVKIAVAQNGHALKHASEELREKKEIVQMAMARDRRVLEYVSRNMREICNV